jgi:ATP-dependent protease ClpP protease subunit
MGTIRFYTFIIAILLLQSDIGLGRQLNLEGKAVYELDAPITNGSGIRLANDIAATKDPEMVLLIDSPGGSVIEMFSIMNSMHLYQSRGGTITCVVVGGAYSAAFQVLSKCDNRLALPYSTLLFHSAYFRYMGVVNEKLAYRMYQGMKLLTYDVDRRLAKMLKLPYRDFKEYNDASYMWSVGAFQNKFPNFIRKIDGLRNIPSHIRLYE